jgi:hypothetical protein
MTGRALIGRCVSLATLALGLSGCTSPGQRADAVAELAQFVVREIPETAHRDYIDFGGKVALVAHELSPDGKAGPGQSMNAKLYWKPLSVISPGFSLFTHLEDSRGRQIRNYDEVGTFRKWLVGKAPASLALLELGKVYVDEQTIDLPQAADLAPEVLLVVGAFTEDHPRHYTNLPVVSGPSNGRQAGIVARIDTGLAWPKVAAKRSDKEVRR